MREYSLRFNSLSRYAPNVVATIDDRGHQYVDRLDPYLVRDCTIAALNKDMDIARIQDFAQKMEDQRQRRRTQESERGIRPQFSARPPRPLSSYSAHSASP